MRRLFGFLSRLVLGLPGRISELGVDIHGFFSLHWAAFKGWRQARKEKREKKKEQLSGKRTSRTWLVVGLICLALVSSLVFLSLKQERPVEVTEKVAAPAATVEKETDQPKAAEAPEKGLPIFPLAIWLGAPLLAMILLSGANYIRQRRRIAQEERRRAARSGRTMPKRGGRAALKGLFRLKNLKYLFAVWLAFGLRFAVLSDDRLVRMIGLSAAVVFGLVLFWLMAKGLKNQIVRAATHAKTQSPYWLTWLSQFFKLILPVLVGYFAFIFWATKGQFINDFIGLSPGDYPATVGKYLTVLFYFIVAWAILLGWIWAQKGPIRYPLLVVIYLPIFLFGLSHCAGFLRHPVSLEKNWALKGGVLSHYALPASAEKIILEETIEPLKSGNIMLEYRKLAFGDWIAIKVEGFIVMDRLAIYNERRGVLEKRVGPEIEALIYPADLSALNLKDVPCDSVVYGGAIVSTYDANGNIGLWSAAMEPGKTFAVFKVLKPGHLVFSYNLPVETGTMRFIQVFTKQKDGGPFGQYDAIWASVKGAYRVTVWLVPEPTPEQQEELMKLAFRS